MSPALFQGAIEEGFIYALVALGLLISYGILDIADMTTDGSFVLGAATSSMLVISGHPLIALFVALLAGAVAGFVTAKLQTDLGVPSILAGIITMTGLYSINLVVQGGVPNLFYDGEETVFSKMSALVGEKLGVLLLLILIVAIICIILIFFFSTRIGLSIRATGDNPAMVQASSINPRFTITIGLAMSNGLVALAGALWAQKTTSGDINMGTGVVVIGLASLVLGTLFFRKKAMIYRVMAAVVGAILYRIIFTIALRYTENAGYLKIVSAVLLTVIMAYPTIKQKIHGSLRRRKEQRDYADAQQD